MRTRRKAFISLLSIVVTITIISALILLIMNKLYFTEKPFANNAEINPLTESIDSSGYRSVIRRSEKTAESLNSKFQDQQNALDRW